MLIRSRDFHRGGIYNLWATRGLAERIKNELEGAKRKGVFQSYTYNSSVPLEVYHLQNIEYDEPGDSKNLWATNSLAKRIKKELE